MKRFCLSKPEIFCVLALLYFIVGALVIFNPLMKQINPNLSLHPLTVFVWFFGLSSFLLGLKYSNIILKAKSLPIFVMFTLSTVFLHYVVGFGWLFAGVVNISSLLLCLYFIGVSHCYLKETGRSSPVSPGMARFVTYLQKRGPLFKKLKNHFILSFVIGFFIFVLNLFLTGIPALNIDLHHELIAVNPYFIYGMYLMLLPLTRVFSSNVNVCRIGFLFLALLMTLTTFRTYLGIVVITWIFLEFGSSKMRRKTAFLLVLIIALTAVLFVFMGHILVLSKGPWKLDPVGTTAYRIGFTVHILDDMVKRAFPFGYSFGRAMIMNSAGKFICGFYNCSSLLTATTMGEVMIDFGLVGVFTTMFFMGAVLQQLYEVDYPLYSLLMAHAIVTIDVGVNILLLTLLSYIGYARLRKWI